MARPKRNSFKPEEKEVVHPYTLLKRRRRHESAIGYAIRMGGLTAGRAFLIQTFKENPGLSLPDLSLKLGILGNNFYNYASRLGFKSLAEVRELATSVASPSTSAVAARGPDATPPPAEPPREELPKAGMPGSNLPMPPLP